MSDFKSPSLWSKYVLNSSKVSTKSCLGSGAEGSPCLDSWSELELSSSGSDITETRRTSCTKG